MNSIHITPAESDADILRCFPVMAQLRPHLVEAEFVARVRRMQSEGFRLARLEEEGTVRAVAGYRFHEKLFSGRTLYVDDLVSDTTRRSQGHGARLLAWLAEQARARDCDLLELDSGVQRFDAHRFYFRERMRIASYHFSRALKG
ncbi:MAG: Acetyltransferase (GNAT) family protein [Verrucomicrobia bacterium]|nr:MAG: Acetyltransferase (GNAT) family protein [Verrucomicrobiota bacterium]